jgi:uncharacterized protein YndB with AHSA1/START domain
VRDETLPGPEGSVPHWNAYLDQLKQYFEEKRGERRMMKTTAKALEVTVARNIPAPTSEVFDAWLDPKVPGTLWHEHEKLIFNPKVDGLWYLLTLAHRIAGTPHYGRFIEISRPGLIRHSWVSPHTLGEESTVTVRFDKEGDGTRLTLVHSGLPNEAMANAHEKGWNSILNAFSNVWAHE